MNTLVDLRQIPLFASLSEAVLTDLAKEVHVQEAGAGEMLLREGECGDRLLIILDGALEVIKAHGTPDERSLGRPGVGEIVGEISLLEPEGSRTASVRAISAARLLVLTREDFDRLLLRAPAPAIQVLRILSNRLRNADEAAIRDLHHKNQQLALAYERLQAAQEQLVEKERLERELQVARRIQESMLPDVLPELPDFDFGAVICPARAVGGDLYDVFLLDEGRAAVVIGDVSDKGVPAALFMAQARSLVRAVAAPDKTPTEVVNRLNQLLLDMNAMGLFITLLYGVVDREAHKFTYTRAGHEIPLLFDASHSSISIEPGKGRLLGVFPDTRLEEQTIPLSPGATMFLFTDGAADAIDANGKRFGYERLESTVCASLGGSAQAVCDRVLTSLQSFRGETPQVDDITLVAVKAL
jgi:sigma-B regulation protein RsbU (phosphoserine phosphatase)